MYIRIRKVLSEDPAKDLFVDVSPNTLVKHVKNTVEKNTGIPSNEQKLFFSGKQLAYGKKILEYGLKLNDVVLLMVKDKSLAETPKSEAKPPVHVRCFSKFYKIGDKVDVRCIYLGCWFEGTIVAIEKKTVLTYIPNVPVELLQERNFIFYVFHDSERIHRTTAYNINDIRPRAFYTYISSELTIGLHCFVNYNFEEPDKLGFWYDMKITGVNEASITGDIVLGNGKPNVPNCQSIFMKEVMRIERPALLTERVGEPTVQLPLRKMCPQCWICNDEPSVECMDCGCRVCFSKREPNKILVCDECDEAYHIYCLTPPLTGYPEDTDWYCNNCKNNDVIVLPVPDAEEAAASTSAASASDTKSLGMARVGRNSVCTIVPLTHFGPIPGIEVGMTWKFRLQVSAAGVHRPSMAGIHGRSSDGAYSIILSGGYEDDVDDGNSIIYTGSGGRSLSGSKQGSDQQLTFLNKALALNCNAPFNRSGASAKNWKEGKPVRVLRSYKFKRSKYAPKDGIRYDGIYKVQKYYRKMGQSGHFVWRFLLKRDDTNPAPWEKGGHEYPIEYPDGYLEANSNKENAGSSKSKKNEVPTTPVAKKPKLIPFVLSENLQNMISDDVNNAVNWKQCEEVLQKGKKYFLDVVKETFLCVCCQDLVYCPVTTICKHNICKNCLLRSFDCELFSCPYCRTKFGQSYVIVINKILACILSTLFPGYEQTRLD